MLLKKSINKPIFFAVVTFLQVITAISYTLGQEPTVHTALQHYLHKPDSSYRWSVVDSSHTPEVRVYQILLTSQRWKDITWQHQLTILVPTQLSHPTALLYIAGGNTNKEGLPNWNNNPADRHFLAARKVAIDNQVPVALIRQTPNQPLFGGKREDELISMTLHRYKADRDLEWPLLFPMVKSASKAMDATQDFMQRHLHYDVQDFIVTGLSKRGWTTWLTGASDKRVRAIAPMVIDVLNMPVSLQYQIDTWGDYSIEIQDYVNLGIPQESRSESGQEITAMIDPYSYRKNLQMPKMLFMGTNDPYWVLDNVKNYLDSIPGDNRLQYIPNAGHDLGDGTQAAQALSSFVFTTVNDLIAPPLSWKTVTRKQQTLLDIDTDARSLVRVELWTASSPTKDFRKAHWTSTPIDPSKQRLDHISLPRPQHGYQAYYLTLTYSIPDNRLFSQCTRTFIVDQRDLL